MATTEVQTSETFTTESTKSFTTQPTVPIGQARTTYTGTTGPTKTVANTFGPSRPKGATQETTTTTGKPPTGNSLGEIFSKLFVANVLFCFKYQLWGGAITSFPA